jgi:hypothetical protein
MASLTRTIRHLAQSAVVLCMLVINAAGFLRLCLRSPAALAAENLFLRKQLALYQERHVKPPRATNATRCALIWLSHWFDWRQALTVVQPETFTRWQRQGFGLFRHWASCPGRPPTPVELQGLIRQMARDNLTWGQRRIANELRLKLGLRVSPRTVRKYMPRHLGRGPDQCVPSQRWHTFLRNHTWDLIIRGVSADLTRGVQALFAQIMRLLQRWQSQSAAHRLQKTTRSDAVSIALRRDTAPLPMEWSPATEEVRSVDDRSPPALGPPWNSDTCTTARATFVDMPAWRPAGAVLCWWTMVSPRSHGGTQATSLRQVA